MPWPDSALLQGCINLHIHVTAMFGCDKYFFVHKMTDWECESQSFPAACGVSGGTDSFTTLSRLTGTLRMFLLGGDRGGR